VRKPLSDRQAGAIFAIAARQVCNEPDDALAPQKLVGHGRNWAHVNAAQDPRAALDEVAKGKWDQISRRREDDRGSASAWSRFD
jgi:hypothetical protein